MARSGLAPTQRSTNEPSSISSGTAERLAAAALALAIALGFWFAADAYHVPTTRGGDRNAYLLGGRMLAEGHFGGIHPADPFINYGEHWVTARPGTLQLKFPLGLPVIYALIHLLGGAANWPADGYGFSPIAASFAIWGSFFLFRSIVGAFYALLGEMLLAASPVVFFFANLPNSHATALCVAVWGMVLLLGWHKNGGAWRTVLAGLFLGFNYTVRYTEGLLVLPLLLAALFHLRTRRKQAILLAAAWLAPVAMQLIYNLFVLHHFSGYALTRESTAFSFSYFLHNGPTMIADLYHGGLRYVLPLSLIGAVLLLKSNRRLGTIVWVWFLPPVVVYSSYYWNPDDAGPDGEYYLRFVLTVLPALILCAMWLFRRFDGNFTAIVSGLFVAITVALELGAGTAAAADMQWSNLTSLLLLQRVEQHVPPGSVIFGQGGDLIMLEVAGDWRLYTSDLFTARNVQSFQDIAAGKLQGLQPQRARQLIALLGGKSDRELVLEQNDLVRKAMGEGREVFAVLPRGACEEFCKRYGLTPELIDRWQVDGRWCGRPSADMELIAVQPAALPYPLSQ